MKFRDVSAEPPAPRPSATWLVVPLAALVTSGVLGLALFGEPDDEASRALTGGPLLARPMHEVLPRGEVPPPVAAGTAAIAPSAPSAPPPAPLPTAADVAPITLASASRMVPIEIYTASWCRACATAERWMNDNDIAYSEIDVDRHPGAREQLIALNPRRTLPTFDVAGDVLIGFDPSRLGAAIEGAARRRVH